MTFSREYSREEGISPAVLLFFWLLFGHCISKCDRIKHVWTFNPDNTNPSLPFSGFLTWESQFNFLELSSFTYKLWDNDIYLPSCSGALSETIKEREEEKKEGRKGVGERKEEKTDQERVCKKERERKEEACFFVVNIHVIFLPISLIF